MQNPAMAEVRQKGSFLRHARFYLFLTRITHSPGNLAVVGQQAKS
jgi:hypothetical protein